MVSMETGARKVYPGKAFLRRMLVEFTKKILISEGVDEVEVIEDGIVSVIVGIQKKDLPPFTDPLDVAVIIVERGSDLEVGIQDADPDVSLIAAALMWTSKTAMRRTASTFAKYIVWYPKIRKKIDKYLLS